MGTKVRQRVFPNAAQVRVIAMKDEGRGEKLVGCSVRACGALVGVAVWPW